MSFVAVMTPRRAVTVLVVDDNADHRLLIERRLTDVGYAVRQAPSGEAALASLDGVDLVLLDYRLPGLSGLEALQAIVARRGPSVVMVTGMGSENIAVEAMRSGAIDYLVKDPGYLTTLPQVVERAWRHHDLSRRAGELQRLALLVTSGAERGATFDAIVSGARTLLGADACTVHALEGTTTVLEAQAGEVAEGDELVDRAADALRQFVAAPTDPLITDHLVIPITTPEGEPAGVLTVVTEQPRGYAREELELARTFASYAGIALANLRRLELERELVVELQRMLDLRRDFVAHVSHELRTPLTCVQGFAQTLLSHWDGIADAERAEFVGKIHAHAIDLANLVGQLLDFSTVEAGRLEPDFQPVDPRAEAEAVMDALGPLLSERSVQVTGPSVTLVADAGLVRRVLTNLLSNAVKYSDAGSAINIAVEPASDVIVVSVSDEGRGLSPEEQDRVFEPFWRSSAVSRGAVRGTGIGLTLVREYVRVMGGRVGVESRPGAGARFWFSLPLRPDHDPAGDEPQVSLA